MTMTSTATTARPRRSELDRATALRLAATEYERYLDLLRSLARTTGPRPTDCPAWDVRAMASHNLGMAEMAGSLPEMVRQFAGGGAPEEVGRRRHDRPPGRGPPGADPGGDHRSLRPGHPAGGPRPPPPFRP